MKAILSAIIVSCLLLFTVPHYAQPQFPDELPVYNSDVVAKIYITIDPDSLLQILDDIKSDHEFPANFVFDNGFITESVDTIGFRLRGNTSRYSAKKSFKVSFNTFFPGRKFYGLEKLNLNGEHNDPSIIRSKLSWDIMRRNNVPAPRSSYTELYINNQYYGLYINVEHIDENFVKSRFGANDGNLYKCLWPADMNYISDNPNAYKFFAGDRRAYDLKTNVQQDDYSDLANLISVLNLTPDNQLVNELEKVFNVNDYLRAIAVEVLVGHWDNLWFNKNNFYLYKNTTSGKFEYIPFDLDNTFGIWWDGISPGIDWGDRSIYDWGHPSESRPMADRILSIDLYKDRFTFYMQQLLAQTFNPGYMEPRIDIIHDMITPAAEADLYRTLDYGYTVDDFHNSYTQALGAHVTYGLKPFIQSRNSSAISQMDIEPIPPIISYVRHTPALPGPDDPITILAFLEDESPATLDVNFYFNDGNGWQNTAMFDDGQHNDDAANDGTYGVIIDALGANQAISYYIRATDNNNTSTNNPAGAPSNTLRILTGLPQAALFINEFMASNDLTISDPFGEFDDWVEIYNGEDSTIWLGDKFLSDNLTNPTKWALPDTSIAPGSHLLLWIDGTPAQGPLHAPFRLSRDGEQVGIFNADSLVIDSVSYGFQETDVSFGRVTDGDAEWQSFNSPTPGMSNNPLGINEDNLPTMSNIFHLGKNYPNPFNGETIIPFRLSQSANIKLEIFNILGQKIVTLANSHYPAGAHQVKWAINENSYQEIVSGIYFLQMSGVSGIGETLQAKPLKILLIK